MTKQVENLKKRAGVSLAQIMIGLGLAAVTAAVVGPRFMNANLPGYKSNIKEEINNFQDFTEGWITNHDGSTANLKLKTIVSSGLMTGSMLKSVYKADGTVATANGANLAGDNTDYYAPRWAGGDVKIYITGNSDAKTANMYIDMTASTTKLSTNQYAEIETAVKDHAGVKFGTDAVDGGATTIGNTVITSAVASDSDGKIELSIQ